MILKEPFRGLRLSLILHHSHTFKGDARKWFEDSQEAWEDFYNGCLDVGVEASIYNGTVTFKLDNLRTDLFQEIGLSRDEKTLVALLNVAYEEGYFSER